jgi:hypothetical protein
MKKTKKQQISAVRQLRKHVDLLFKPRSEKSLLKQLAVAKNKSVAEDILFNLVEDYPCETYEEYYLGLREDNEENTRSTSLKEVTSMAKRGLKL